MSDIKCGKQGYSGPKCKIKDFDRCDELEAGAKLTELYPGKSKKHQQNKLKYIDRQIRKDGFWLVNSEADGVCWNDAWYLYELPKEDTRPQVQSAKKGEDISETAEGFVDDVGDFFNETIKGYQRKVEKVKEEGAGGIFDNFWKEITGVLGTIALIITIKALRSRSKRKKAEAEAEKKKAEAAAAKRRLEQEAKLRAAELQAQPTVGSQRFADEAPVPLVTRTPVPGTKKAMPAEPSRPTSESSGSGEHASQPPAEGRTPIGLDEPAPVCEETADPFADKEKFTSVDEGQRKTVPGDYEAKTVQMGVQNGQAEDSQSSRSTALPPKEDSAEFADTGVEKMRMYEPDVMVVEAIVDIDPGGEISTLKTFENEYGITMDEKTLKKTAIIVYEQVFSREGYDDYSRIFEAIVSMSFEKAVKDKQNQVDVEHAKKACLDFMGVQGEEAVAEFDADAKKDLAKYKLWINRAGRHTFDYGQKHHVSADKPNGSGNGTHRSETMSAAEKSGKDPATAAMAEVPPEALAEVKGMRVSEFQQGFPLFKSIEYYEAARKKMGDFIRKTPGYLSLYRTTEQVAEIQVAFTTVLNEAVESVAERFFNEKDGVTYEGATAATQKAQAISNGSSKPFHIPGLDPIPAVTEHFNEAQVETMVDRAMDKDAELKGLQPFERAEYKANVMTAMRETPGFEADFVKDGKISPEGVKAAMDYCAEKNGRSVSGTRAEQMAEIRKDTTKVDGFEDGLKLSDADWEEIETNAAKKMGKKK